MPATGEAAFRSRVARLVGRTWRLSASRRQALSFFPDPIEHVAALLQESGFTLPDNAGPAAGLFHRAADVVGQAALIGTPPHGVLTLDLDGFERLARVRSWNRRAVARLMSSLINAHIASHRSCLGDPNFWTHALDATRRVGSPYIAIGDSHSLCACILGGTVRCPTIPIHVLCTAGSAAGLNNRASRSGYGMELAGFADALRMSVGGSDLPILLQFGQVDVEFVSVFHRIARSENVFDRGGFEAFCETAVDAYTAFLARCFPGFDALHVLSIFPPALTDDAWTDGYTNAHVAQLEGDRDAEEISALVRSIAIPVISERTALHRYFNERLAARCRSRSLTFVDLFDRFVGRDGTIAARFNRFSGGRDHHISTSAARKVIRPVIERIVAGT